MADQTNQIKVFTSHFGYLSAYCLGCLRGSRNNGNEVTLIGDDETCSRYSNSVNLKDISMPLYNEFLSSFKKLTFYNDFYEESYWKRLFALHGLMCEKNIDKCFLMDSDVMLTTNLKKNIYPLVSKYNAGLVIKKQEHEYTMAASLHFSYFTLQALEDYLNFSIKTYKNYSEDTPIGKKWLYHKKNNIPGGVTEMTIAYLWSQEREDIKNFLEPDCGFVGMNHLRDTRIFNGVELQSRNGLIEMHIPSQGEPTVKCAEDQNSEYKLIFIHFQGNSKLVATIFTIPGIKHFYTSVFKRRPLFRKWIKTFSKVYEDLLIKTGVNI